MAKMINNVLGKKRLRLSGNEFETETKRETERLLGTRNFVTNANSFQDFEIKY